MTAPARALEAERKAIAAHPRPPAAGSPTLVERPGALFPGGEGAQLRFVSPWTFRQNLARAAWMIAAKLLFRPSFHNWYGWRRLLLRTFGARIARDVRIRPTAHIEIPWNLDIREGAVVGDYAILYSLGPITIGRRAVVSQYAHLCAGTHDYRYRDFPLLRPPIVIGDGAWIAADAFVGPNVTVGDGAVIGARSSVFKDIPPNMVAAGNPARPIKPRVILDEEGAPSAEAPPEAIPHREPREPAEAVSGNGDGGPLKHEESAGRERSEFPATVSAKGAGSGAEQNGAEA
jgi:putative colanic acid biosynthesis acetyltransferase WcaF